MNTKDYFDKEMSGEPLCEESVIFHMKRFTRIKMREQRQNCFNEIRQFFCLNLVKFKFIKRILIAKEPEL